MTFHLFEDRLRSADDAVDGGRAAWHRSRRAVRAVAGCRTQAVHHPVTEDRPNPLYRRICYTVAWSEAIAFALLTSPAWRLRWSTAVAVAQLYEVPTFPSSPRSGSRCVGLLPRVKRSTQGEGHERRYSTGRCGRDHRAADSLGAVESAAPDAPSDAFKRWCSSASSPTSVTSPARAVATHADVPGEIAVSE